MIDAVSATLGFCIGAVLTTALWTAAYTIGRDRELAQTHPTRPIQPDRPWGHSLGDLTFAPTRPAVPTPIPNNVVGPELLEVVSAGHDDAALTYQLVDRNGCRYTVILPHHGQPT
jgi:hypothetical protein